VKVKRLFSFGLIAVGAILVLVAAAGLLFGGVVQVHDSEMLPDQLAGLPLASTSTGQQAVAEINRMHGLNFPLLSGAVGRYGGDGQATLWVSEAQSASLASQMLEDMAAKIAQGSSPFKPADVRLDGGRKVYELEGLGQRHFYFQSRAFLVWLAVDSDLVERALGEVLRFFPE
jgi:hypothetical protein